MPAWLPSLDLHLMISTVAVLIYIVNARAHRERRAPAAAIAWVMGLALLPYLMLPLYLMFGQRKLKAAPRPSLATASTDSHWGAVLLGSFGLDPPSGARIRFHRDGPEAFDALCQIIDGARERLDLCTFLIGNDATGHEVLRRLALRAQAGVRVRLLIDGLGGWGVPADGLRALRESGGQVAVFRPLFSLRRQGPRNLRNHRKLTIADEQRLWAGGRNLAAEYFAGSAGSTPWTDLSFDLEGGVAAAATKQFEADWLLARGTTSQLPPAVSPPVTSGSLAQFLPSGPDQSEDTAHALLLDACFRAEHRVLAVTPYFVPGDSLCMALRLAARRGVEVKLLLPARSNHQLADFVRDRALRELADAGAEIRLLPGMVHAKAVVIDDSLALCGSINLDLRSLLLNHESAVVFYGDREIDWLARWLDTLGGQAEAYIPQPPGMLRDVAEGLLLTVAFQL